LCIPSFCLTGLARRPLWNSRHDFESLNPFRLSLRMGQGEYFALADSAKFPAGAYSPNWVETSGTHF